MRGARRVSVERLAAVRIIPADAGSTSIRLFDVLMDRDHPRGCGEHFAFS